MTAQTERDDDFGVLDLDDMPGIPPLVRNARVAAELLFVDPPPLFAVSANPYEISIVGSVAAEIAEWCARHYLSEVDGWELDGTNWRRWQGVIEGVPVRVDCEVTA